MASRTSSQLDTPGHDRMNKITFGKHGILESIFLKAQTTIKIFMFL